jgi:hypothetical protein
MLHFFEQYIRGFRPALTPWKDVPHTTHIPETVGLSAANARPASDRRSSFDSVICAS